VARKQRFLKAGAVPYWVLVTFLILTFFTGGGSRADIQSLIILRPAAVIYCGIALWSLRWEHVKAYKFLFGMSAAIIALVGSHLIPLPPSIWGALPGREIITEIDKVAELGKVWRPLAMVPSSAWNAFYSLFVPLAVLLLGVQLSREDRCNLLPWLLGLGLISGFLGLLQSIGDPQGPLYFYRVTNEGSAVGLFSNRNHQAILLATIFPMLAVTASTNIASEESAYARVWASMAAATVLVPLILVTGSRTGLIVGAIGLLSVNLVYHRPDKITSRKRKSNRFNQIPLAIFFSFIFLVGVTVIASRAVALQRLISPADNDSRIQSWQPIIHSAWKYFPTGSGVSSYVEIFQIDEPFELLNTAYSNHAHNDWLEIYLTLGLPGLVLLTMALYAFFRAALRAFQAKSSSSKNASFARLGTIVMAILAIGSITDYPLRTPSLACVFVLAGIWLTASRSEMSKSTGSL
jgi:O-antigen ligase